MTEFKVPELGENVASGDVARVLVNVGDVIAKEQPVVELETDKATIEVPSSVAGKVTEIKVKQGDKIKVGAVVLVVDDAGAGNGAGGAKQADAPRGESQQQEAPPVTAPEAAKAPEKPEKVVSMPSRAEAPKAVEPAKAAAPQPKATAPSAAAVRTERGPAAPAAPSVRRLAREIGIDIDQVQGSGPGGRIAEGDVKEHARRILSSVPSASPGAGGGALPGAGGAGTSLPAIPLPDFEKWGEVERQAMSNIRRTTSERLSHAWITIPHVTQFDKADITAMEELRRKYREQIAKAGGNLTVTAMLVKVLATAVQKFPQFNASLDPERQQIVYKKSVHIGVAVDTDRGLLVPVVRDADRKNIQEIAIEVHQLAEKARGRKLTLDEMSGGGMTISNLGGIGGTYFTPIVNWPEVAILGVSRGIIEPVWRPAANGDGGTFEPRQLLPLSLSYDHRVIDGADAMRFLRWVVEAIEQPFLLSLIG
jgi:pyruvate dehydrogenase E2 component (dihydrolipoamide acetyltransferase)